VNDAWGHAAGDVLLAEIGDRIRVVAGSMSAVGRFGGDEYVVIVEAATKARALELAGHLHRAISEPVILNGHRVSCRASIGVAINSPDAESLLRDASAAAADAKRQGGARTRIYD